MEGFDMALQHAQQRFAERFGGFTVMEGKGGWKENGRVVTEPATIVEAYGDVAQDNAVIFMDGVAEYIVGVNLYDEDAIMFTVDNSQYLVETGDGRLKHVA